MTKQPKPEKPVQVKQALKKVRLFWTVTANVIVFISIIVATAGVIYYSHGYRFSLDGKVEKVGVMSLSSKPILAGIFIDEDYKGVTPKTLGAITPGEHKVKMTKEGYYDWNKTVTILQDKSTPIDAIFFRKKPKSSEVLKIDGEVIGFTTDLKSRNIFITTRLSSDIQSPTAVYKIYKYSTNNVLWENAGNPTLIYEKSLEITKSFAVEASPDGAFLLLTYSTTQDNSVIKSYETVDANRSDLKTYPIPTEIAKIIKNITWSNNSKELIIQSENAISMLSPKELKLEVLLERTYQAQTAPGFAWTTDENGNLYFSELIIPTDPLLGKSYFQIKQVTDPLSEPQVIIDEVYFVENDKFIKDTELNDLQTAFKSSPQSTRFAGDINYLKVDVDAKGIIISTQFGLYYYNTESRKFTLVAKESGEFIATNSDQERFLFATKGQYGVFTFEKEEADHTVKLGTTFLSEKLEGSQAFFHDSDQYVMIVNPNDITAVDIDSDNMNKLVSFDIYATVSQDGHHAYVMEAGSTSGYRLLRYSLN